MDFAIAGQMQETLVHAVLLVAFILCEVLFYYGYSRLSAKYVTGCTKQLKRDVFAGILSRDYVTYRQCPQGAYLAKYTSETDAIKDCCFQLLPRFWEIFFKICFVSLALFVLNWKIALITLVLLTTPLYLPKLIEKKLQKAQEEQIAAVEKALANVNDWLNGFEVIKNFSVERKILQKFDDVNDCAMEKLLRNSVLGATAQLITTLISYLSYFVVLVCATWLVLKGTFSAGDFFIAIGMIDQLSYPLIALAGIIRQLVAIRPACAEMEQFLAEGEKAEQKKTLQSVKEKIVFSNVTFAYPGKMPVLQGFDFTARRGKRYLIKGPSGCGKTTTVNLLLRYYDVTDGKISVDDVPISCFDSTYGGITVVRQEAVLFCDTLRNNLTMYRNLPDERLVEVLERLGLHKFANKAALDGMVMENGANLSGGEKKRICLARALLRDTDVLILDEPLANLDAAAAERIEDLLLSIPEKLVLVVSHQFTPEKLDRFDGILEFAKA